MTDTTTDAHLADDDHRILIRFAAGMRTRQIARETGLEVALISETVELLAGNEPVRAQRRVDEHDRWKTQHPTPDRPPAAPESTQPPATPAPAPAPAPVAPPDVQAEPDPIDTATLLPLAKAPTRKHPAVALPTGDGVTDDTYDVFPEIGPEPYAGTIESPPTANHVPATDIEPGPAITWGVYKSRSTVHTAADLPAVRLATATDDDPATLLRKATDSGNTTLCAAAAQIRILLADLRRHLDRHERASELRATIARLRTELAAAEDALQNQSTIDIDFPTVRAWAHANGITCPDTGRIPAAVAKAYKAAHQPIGDTRE